MKRSERGRALFHTRDSGGKHETTPGEYVDWARRRAKELGVRFSGTPEQIESMIAKDVSVDGDIFLDCGASWQDVWALTDITEAKSKDGKEIEH